MPRPRLNRLELQILEILLIGLSVAMGDRLWASAPAPDHHGTVMFGKLMVPGATVTLVRGDQRRVGVTDEEGVYRIADVAEGPWTITIEMLGFVTLSQEVAIDARIAPPIWQLTLAPFDQLLDAASPDIVRTEARGQPTTPSPSADVGQSNARESPDTLGGFERARVQTVAPAMRASGALFTDTDPKAADGFLISGSVNNAAASPFAQLVAFGNNRRAGPSLYNGGIALLLGNSALDARPFSSSGAPAPKPTYQDTQIAASLSGPFRIPGLIRRGPTMFLGYQRTVDNRASTGSALMPTALERAGDFSQTRDRLGRPVRIFDPVTGQPFAGNVIPSNRLSPQAASLLGYYPLPNVNGGDGFNYQTPTLLSTRQDAVQSRVTNTFNQGHDQIFNTLAYQRTTTESSNIFSFVDATRVSGVDTAVNWWHRLSHGLSMRLRYQFTRLKTSATPYFADRTNVSGDAGITGNNQDPVNWGPPRLLFSSGVAGLRTADSAANRNDTQSWGGELLWSRGSHTITMGGDVRWQQWNIVAQQDPHGSFTFTGRETNSALADFLLGLPHASSIAFGNADKFVSAPAYNAYISDDWRVNPIMTVNAGVRWEYEAPVTERLDRLVNLDVAPSFRDVSPIVATDPFGPLTGQRYPASLMRPDRGGIQPRVGLALRPVPGSSLVVRAGYGIYRNTQVYQPIGLLLAQQPPLSTTATVETTAVNPLTLENGFRMAASGEALNTFAVDPDFRVGYAHNWQVLVQRDLPASLTVVATYLGTAGRHLMQESLPNTVPPGATSPCPACPRGFIYLTSNGRSRKHTGQVQLRRRMRDGLTASIQYALSKATDDAGAFTGVRLEGSAIAQDWQDPGAEDELSNFDQRHLVTAHVEYTTGVGMGGGGSMDGLKGRLFDGWILTGHLTSGSGLPLTPIYLTSVPGTGVTGTIRPDVDETAAASVSDGYFANPAAYTAPAAGEWGDARRNSIRGPAQFSLDAGIGRSHLWGERVTLDWRLEATNLLNRVTYAGVNTVVGSPQFGLPVVANPMRKIRLTFRLRF